MRRTTAVTAALIAASSIALIAPAHAAPAGQRLTAVASCDGGGQVKVVSGIDADGTQHGKATVHGVQEKHWAGELILGLDDNNSDDVIDSIESNMKKYVAKHGGFSTSGEFANSTTQNAMGVFASKNLKAICEAGVVTLGDNRFAATGANGGIAVKTGPKPRVMAFLLGEQHHRYRFTFTVHTKTGVKHWVLNRAATHKFAGVQATIRNAWHLPSFKEVSVTVTDLTKPGAPASFKLER